MKTIHRYLLALICLLTLAVGAQSQSAKVVRTIKSANPEPQMYNWHSHNRLGLERGAFAGVKDYSRVLIREESGDVVEVPFFHFTARDLGELVNKMAKFPAETKVIDYTPSDAPIVDLKPSELKLGPLNEWPNHGVLGGSFHSMNTPPVVEDIQGRRAVHFDCNFWFYDTQYTAMVLDTMPAKALKEDMPFTLSCWVLHPKDPDGDDPEMIMSWHSRFGNNGTGLDWKRETGRGDFYVMGLGGDLWVEPHMRAKPMMEWTHVAYVYNGGGLKGELRIYENGKLVALGRSKYVPQLRDPVQITKDSVVLKGNLDTVDEKQLAYVRGYVGEYDAHHFGQLRHIGRWDQMNEIGLKPRGEFEIPFNDLKPGTRYYYRMFATEDPTSYENPGEPTRRWANGAGRFVTATADGKPGQLVPFDTDRYIFLGTQWGSRWYSSFSGPAGLFRGYIGNLKLYDRALTDDEVRRDANAMAPCDGTPANDGTVDIDKADFGWTSGTSAAKSFRFYMDTDRKKVVDGTATSQETKSTKIEKVKLQPGRMHYWRVDALGADGKVLAKGNIWQFHVTYGEPSKPGPEDNSSTSDTGYFSWTQTIGTLREQRLYLSLDRDAVANGTARAVTLNGGQRDYFAPPSSLNFGVTYYWRVESVLADDTLVPGPIWTAKIIDYYTPESDGPASEPYTDGITPSRAAKVLNGFGYPTISTPRAPESDLLDIMHATNRFLRKSPQLRNMLASHPCATTMASIEGPPCVDGYWCGSYGGLPTWNITMHEMGHQVLMNGLGPMYPDFYQRLTDVFNLHADNNAWLGDYAAVNIHENIAVNAHGFISGGGRESMLVEDAPTFFLLSEYLPGDLAIDLHPAFGVALDAANNVVKWDNRGSVEDRMPNGQGYCPIPDTVGTFQATGSPKLNTAKGATGVVFGGSDALVWDRGLQYGFEKNRAWSVEFWARRDSAGSGDELLLGWGPEDKGVRLYWGGSPKAWTVGGNSSDWPAKPEIGKWNHIVFIFEGGGLRDGAGPMRLFLNGKEVLTKSYKLDLAAKMPVQIGGLVNSGKVDKGFNGTLGHVRVYNYAISVYQVAEHYAQEYRGYERTSPPNIGGRLYVDLDATQLEEIGTEDHFPLYPASLCKPWVRSWANKGILQGRVHNDISDQWHYSGSTPLYRQVAGVQALRFMGKDRMVGAWDIRGSMVENGAGTLEAVVYSEANSPDEVVLEWGKFILDARYLKPGWQHVAVTPNGSNSIVYIDGVKAGEIPEVLKPGKLDHLNLGAHFDRRRESWYRFFNGAFAQIRMHEDTLTPEQIAANARQSPVFAAHTPSPADGARVVVARKPALSWVSGRDVKTPEPVLLGEDPAKLAAAGNFKPGEFKPDLAGGKRYFWRVGGGPVWSFETSQGELISLSANGLAQGPLASWKNNGTAGGRFVPADRGNLLGMDVETFNGEKGLRMLKGKDMTFRPEGKKADALLKGPYTITFRVASDNFTEPVPFLSWGKPGSPASVWFGTRSSDRRLLTIANRSPRNSGDQYPPDQLKMIYPEGQNAQMAFAWKTITITYADGNAEMWYNTRRIDSRKVDLSVSDLGDLVFGWEAPECNGSILLNDLRIYDRATKQADIELLAKGMDIKGASPIVRISTGDLKTGARLAVLKNQGTLKGTFTAEPDVDRKPTVAQVNGRNAVAFNGVAVMASDFILPDVLADAKPFTVEMWALQDEPSNGTRVLAFSQETSDRPMSFGMGSPADSKAIFRPFCNADWKISRDEQPKQWVHLAWVYDGGEYAKIRLYRDGKLNAEYDYKTMDTIGGYPVTLGGIMSPATAERALFKGAISEVRIFDYPRTAQEIAESAGAK